MLRMKPPTWGLAAGGGGGGGVGRVGCTDWLGGGGGVLGRLAGAEGLTLRLPVLPEDLPPPARAQARSLKPRLSIQNTLRIARRVFSRGVRNMLDSP
jgi:hypothetical protein